MKFTRRISFILLIPWLAITVSVYAQKPRKLMKKAEKAFFNDDVTGATALYEQAAALQPANPRIQYRLGQLYLQQNLQAKAISALENAVKNSPEFNYNYTLSLAEVYQQATLFEAAITLYQFLIDKTDKDEEEEIAVYKKRLLECESGKLLMQAPTHAQVNNPGSQLNSAGEDMSPILINDETKLIFVSQRATLGTRRENEDIFESTKTPEGWSAPKAFSKPINTSNPDAVAYVTPDGNTFYIFQEKNNGDIAEVTRKGSDTWSKPQLLDDPINSDEFEPSFFITKDKQFAFFSSDRPEGFGGLDLYLVMRQPDGSWSEALNLGGNVNTAYDEDAPFISEDGSTLYFSSRGHNSMGGYDIFRSSSLGATWSLSENLGYPVNSPFNDIYFIKTANGSTGYFTSDRAGGLGLKDIYEVSFRNIIATDSITADPEPVVARADAVVNPVVEPVIEAEKTIIVAQPVKEADQRPTETMVTVYGRVIDAKTKLPIAAQISFTDKETNAAPITSTANKKQGNFGGIITKAKTYEMLVQAEGYFFASENITVPKFFSGDSLRRDFKLNKVKAGANLVLKNVFFEYNNHVLTQSSKEELGNLVTLLKENSNIRVQISGHTDNKGKAAYNDALSLKRAQSVISFLVNKGIEKKRLEAVGIGARLPIATNETEKGRSKNRRTEFKVLTN